MKISIHWFCNISLEKSRGCQCHMLDAVSYSLFVFADDGEDDNEHKTDGYGDK